MPRHLNVLVSLLAGVALGSALTVPVTAIMLRFVTPTTVTWDGSSCPAGRYAIAATAAPSGGGSAIPALPLTVRLPAPAVTATWPNLPAGSYTAQATVTPTSGTGQTYTSGPQSVTGLGDPVVASLGPVLIIAPTANATIRGDTTVIVSAPAGTTNVTINLTRGDPAVVIAQTVLPAPIIGTTWSGSLAFGPVTFRGYRPVTLYAVARTSVGLLTSSGLSVTLDNR